MNAVTATGAAAPVTSRYAYRPPAIGPAPWLVFDGDQEIAACGAEADARRIVLAMELAVKFSQPIRFGMDFSSEADRTAVIAEIKSSTGPAAYERLVLAVPELAPSEIIPARLAPQRTDRRRNCGPSFAFRLARTVRANGWPGLAGDAKLIDRIEETTRGWAAGNYADNLGERIASAFRSLDYVAAAADQALRSDLVVDIREYLGVSA